MAKSRMPSVCAMTSPLPKDRMARGLTGKPGRKVSPKVMSALCRIDTRAGDKAAGTAPEGFMGSSYQTRGSVGQRKKAFSSFDGRGAAKGKPAVEKQ